MRKFFLGFLAGVALTATVFCLTYKLKTARPQPPDFVPPQQVQGFPLLPAGAIAFDMKYRGLTPDDDALHYHSFWGWGTDEKETPFIKEVKKRVTDLRLVYSPNFNGAQWSAVELKDGSAVAFYFDLNADGKLSDNEKILPAQEYQKDQKKVFEFVTPDFVMNTNEGQHVPFRALLTARFDKPSSPPNCSWSPYCILEGTSTIDGEPTKLILYSGGVSGSFAEFGRAQFSLLAPAEENTSYISKDTLSSLISYRGQFYRLQLHGKHRKSSAVRVVLEKDTSPRGSLAVKLASDKPLKSKLSHGSIKSTHDKTIHLGISGSEPQLPVAAYKLDSGWIYYGANNDDDWRLNFYEGPDIKIDPEKTCTVELGKPVLSVHAIDEKDRYKHDPEEKSVFSKGTKIYITRKITGKAGERYGRFSQREPGSRDDYDDIKPALTIVDADKNQVLSAQMEYG